MNILIINQPTKNRGDEAAHKAFIRTLLRETNHSYTILFVDENESVIEQMMVHDSRVQYVNERTFISKGKTFVVKLALIMNVISLVLLHPAFRIINKYIKKADYVVCAPGGISLGAFHNWEHLCSLLLAQKKKRTAYFSRSFGPFSAKNRLERVYNKYSYRALQSFGYLSVRDQKTMDLAEQMNIKYVRSIDSVFLDSELHADVPAELSKSLGENYCVVVPNSLVWHPSYPIENRSAIDGLYYQIFDYVHRSYPSLTIVLLPQLFGQGKKGDYNYFLSLTESKNKGDAKIIVVNDSFNSEIQQRIISKAKFVIGARYHSIVFSLNNMVPFVALSYEHKIAGLLSLLNMSNRLIDITSLSSQNSRIENLEEKMQFILSMGLPPVESIELARKIAKTSLLKLSESIKK